MNDLKSLLEGDLARVHGGPPAWREIASHGRVAELVPAGPTAAWPPTIRRRLAPGLVAAASTFALITGLVIVAANEPEPSPATPAPAPTGIVPNELTITCLSDDREQLDTDTVAIQPDGVHILIAQASGQVREVRLAGQGMGLTWQSVGRSEPGGTRSAIASSMEIAVGDALIGCFDPGRATTDVPDDYLRVTFVDPDGLWVSTRLRCGGTPADIQLGSAEIDVAGVPLDQMSAALRERTPGLRPTDVVEPAGFPEAPYPAFRAVRDGDVIARYELDADAASAVMDSCRGVAETGEET